MCTCVNVKMGSYDNQVVLKIPRKFWDKYNIIRIEVGIDKCLAKEIIWLWANDIMTDECCCGHNIEGHISKISVPNDCIDKMKKLGYDVCFNKCRPLDEDTFIAKSI